MFAYSKPNSIATMIIKILEVSLTPSRIFILESISFLLLALKLRDEAAACEYAIVSDFYQCRLDRNCECNLYYARREQHHKCVPIEDAEPKRVEHEIKQQHYCAAGEEAPFPCHFMPVQDEAEHKARKECSKREAGEEISSRKDVRTEDISYCISGARPQRTIHHADDSNRQEPKAESEYRCVD